MKKFLTKSLILTFILIIAASLLYLFEEDKETTSEYLASLTDKHRRVESITTPKIILAGGSNLVFGINSKKIEDEFNIPVVNLGLHAKLGLNFILNELKDIAKPQDIIILSIEHSMTIKGNLELQMMTSYYNPFAYKYYMNEQSTGIDLLKKKLDNHHTLFKKTISNYIEKVKNDPVYNRAGLNIYGDGIKHLEVPSSDLLGSRSIIKDNKDEEIKLLNDFHQFAKEHNIRVVFSYGAYEAMEYEKNKVALHKVHNALRNNLHMEMIMNLEDFVYPTSHFFDSVYHLNKQGQSTHTQNLILKLQKSSLFR